MCAPKRYMKREKKCLSLVRFEPTCMHPLPAVTIKTSERCFNCQLSCLSCGYTNEMQLKFFLHHDLQCAVADKRKYV